MKYQVSTKAEVGISFAPVDAVSEVLQNLLVLLRTTAGTVPLARDMGITNAHIHKPIHTARPLLAASIYDAVARFEPRAQIISLTIDEDPETGALLPEIEVDIYE